MSVAPLKAFLGMDWMKFSLKSLPMRKRLHINTGKVRTDFNYVIV